MTVPSLSVTRTESSSAERRTGRLRCAGRMSSVPTPVCTAMPRSEIIRPSSAPPASSSCWAISRGAISTTWACQPEGAQRVRGFQPEQTAADHHADRRAAALEGGGGAGTNRVEVVEGAVHVTDRQVTARYRRHERIGSGRQHQRVVRHVFTVGGQHHLRGPVDPGDPRTQPQIDQTVARVAVARRARAGCGPSGRCTR